MHLRILALDFDGTLTADDRVADSTLASLERAHKAGIHLILVTGRILDNLELVGRFGELFEAVVAEDGAVVYFPKLGRISLPFGDLTPDLLSKINRLGIPLQHGLAIVATRVPHDQPIAEVLREQGGGASIEYNRGEVMVMPPGATKGTGLLYALNEMGYSPRNVLACGDAENDFSLFEVAELAVAVANAAPGLKAIADVVLTKRDGQGVVQLVDDLLEERLPKYRTRPEHRVNLGEDKEGEPLLLDPFLFLERNLGVIGGSRSGKSWLTGLIAEEMLRLGYQICVIDPEGDYRQLKAFPHMLLLGVEARLPPVADVVAICEHASVSLVLDLSLFSPDECSAYVLELLQALTALRARRGRPHWFLFDEIQNFSCSEDSEMTSALREAMQAGGFALVSYQPSIVAKQVLEQIDHWLITRLDIKAEIGYLESLLEGFPVISKSVIPSLPKLKRGEAFLLLAEDHGSEKKEPVLLFTDQQKRMVTHIRHLHKYMMVPLPAHKRFFFRDANGRFLGISAASLWEFNKRIKFVQLESLRYHLESGDFERWLSDVLHESALAQRLRKISHRNLQDAELRQALVSTVEERYEELESLV